MISSRSLEDLLPAVKAKALAHLAACKDAGIDLLIYCTYRDLESQAALYAQGRTKPGKVVTNAKAGESYHNWRVAYDCVPLVGGKPAWGDTDLYLKVGQLGEYVGLEWSGRWSGKLKETAHFQYTGKLSLRDLAAGKVPL
jgi:peptidoglycan L-alanyl-D-glutamate endopeptidase CwlK